MTLFTLGDAEYLKEYYIDKIIKKLLEPTLTSTIERIEIRSFDKSDNYSVMVFGSKIKGMIPRRSIEIVASNLALSLPDVVLKARVITE